MIYNNLDTGLQNILVYNYEASTKFFIILFLLFISALYLFYIKKNQKETESFFIVAYRILLNLVCNMYLYTFPLMYVMFLHPALNYSNLIVWLFVIYIIMFILFNIYLIWNWSVLLPVQILKVGLLEPSKIKSILSERFKFK